MSAAPLRSVLVGFFLKSGGQKHHDTCFDVSFFRVPPGGQVLAQKLKVGRNADWTGEERISLDLISTELVIEDMPRMCVKLCWFPSLQQAAFDYEVRILTEFDDEASVDRRFHNLSLDPASKNTFVVDLNLFSYADYKG